MRRPSPLGQQRAAVTFDQMQGWYKGFNQYLTETGTMHILSSPQRIFNCDESGFPLCITTGRVLAEKGRKNVYQRVSNTKQQITVLACMSASGLYMPPYIIYPGKRIRNVDVEDFEEASYGTSDSGWMTSELFYDFLVMFSRCIEEEQIQHPVLLLVDGHASHVTLRAAQFCRDNDIILYSLHPHASHIHQPCDLALFSPMKQVWREEVRHWHMEHLGESFLKKSFPAVFKRTWQKTALAENATKGFEKAGIYPFNPAAIDMSRFVDQGNSSAVTPLATDNTAPTPATVPLLAATAPDHQTVPPLAATAPDHEPVPPLAATAPDHEPVPPLAATAPDHEPVPPLAATAPDHEPVPPLAATAPDHQTVPPLPATAPNHKITTSSFSSLTVPNKRTPNSSSKRQCTSGVLPNAISGRDAITILEQKEREKERIQREKEDRKVERLRKKEEREAAVAKRKEETARRKAEAARKKAEKQKIAEQRKKNKVMHGRKRPVPSTSESDSNEESFEMSYMDTDDEEENEEENAAICATCKGANGEATEWVGCDQCPRWYHLGCSGDINLQEMAFNEEDLKNYIFICTMCA